MSIELVINKKNKGEKIHIDDLYKVLREVKEKADESDEFKEKADALDKLMGVYYSYQEKDTTTSYDEFVNFFCKLLEKNSKHNELQEKLKLYEIILDNLDGVFYGPEKILTIFQCYNEHCFQISNESSNGSCLNSIFSGKILFKKNSDHDRIDNYILFDLNTPFIGLKDQRIGIITKTCDRIIINVMLGKGFTCFIKKIL